jgi:hypothetical protein
VGARINKKPKFILFVLHLQNVLHIETQKSDINPQGDKLPLPTSCKALQKKDLCSMPFPKKDLRDFLVTILPLLTAPHQNPAAFLLSETVSPCLSQKQNFFTG